MVRRVTWCRYDQDIAAARERHSFLEWTERPSIEPNEFRLPPLGPSVRQVALHAATDSGRAFEFSPRHPHATARDVMQPACMIGVKMREHDLLDVARTNAERTQLRAELFRWMN